MKKELEERHVVVTGGAGALGVKVVDAVLAARAICHVPCRKRTAPARELLDVVDGLN